MARQGVEERARRKLRTERWSGVFMVLLDEGGAGRLQESDG